MLKQMITEVRIPFNMTIPLDILELLKVFKNNNYALLVVGGAVRDALLQMPIKDYDLATDAHPDKVEEIMKAAGFKTIPTGKAFGVINVFTSEGEYEVATFREDTTSGRNPEVKLGATIESDAKRRDLRINALYYDINTSEIIDLVGGLDDIKRGIIQTVGNPQERFEEDPLRILRYFRFFGRFGYDIDLDITTDAALKSSINLLSTISGERIRDEFIKGIKSAKNGVSFLQIIDKYGLFSKIFKGLSVNKQFINDKNIIIVLSFLLIDNNLDVIKKELNVLKYSSLEISQIYFLISLKNLSADNVIRLKKAQSNSDVNNDQIRNFGSRIGLSSQLLDAFEEFKFTVKSQDLIDAGFSGKELGEEKDRLEKENFLKLLNNL